MTEDQSETSIDLDTHGPGALHLGRVLGGIGKSNDNMPKLTPKESRFYRLL
jgi:hypothetical protein